MKAKKHVIIIGLLLFNLNIVLVTYSQEYFQQNSLLTEYWINTNLNNIEFKVQYNIEGDTIINAIQYKKIISNYPDKRYIGAIREDGSRVYARLNYYDDRLDNEFLLYDFSVQVGDVIKSEAVEGVLSSPDGIMVTQIDEIMLETGEKRKRFHFDRTAPWIEGIGSTGGLLFDTMWYITNYTVPYLVCFMQNDIPTYKNSEMCLDGKCCEKLIVTNIFNYKLSDFAIYPNPTKEIVHINLPFENTQEYISINIYDSFGKIVQNKKDSYKKQVSIDMSGYVSSLYYITIECGNSSILYRIIKQ